MRLCAQVEMKPRLHKAACGSPPDCGLKCEQEQWKQLGAAQAERALGIRAIPRTLSVGESGRSSATLGTSSAEEWLQQAAGESDNDGDSPASMLRYQLMEGERSALSQACSD